MIVPLSGIGFITPASSRISKTNSDSNRWTPSRAEHETPVGPSSVIPVWSKQRAPNDRSMRSRVAGTLAPGSPACTVIRMSLAARSIPAACAASAMRIAYVGVEQSTVVRSSIMVRNRCSVVIAPPGMTSAPRRSAPENADQKPIKGPKEKAKKIRSFGSTPADR